MVASKRRSASSGRGWPLKRGCRAFAAGESQEKHFTRCIDITDLGPSLMTSAETFLKTAARIGRRICGDALWHGTRCNWVSTTQKRTGSGLSTVFGACSPDLYRGTAGIALFLARLDEFIDDAIVRRTAAGALEQAISALDRLDTSDTLSLYTGRVGIAFALLNIGKLWNSESLTDRGLQELTGRLLPPVEMQPPRLDVIEGHAGAVTALVHASKEFDRSDLLNAAVEHGRILLATAEQSDDGWSWNTLPGACSRNQTGYAHGASGIAVALAELAVATGDAAFHKAVAEALRYEMSAFDPQAGGWADYRTAFMKNGKPGYPHGWCVGSAGEGLARLRLRQIFSTPDPVNKDLQAAIDSTIRWINSLHASEIRDLGLCHGVFGSLDFLLSAGQQLGSAELTELAERVGRLAIQHFQDRDLPWPLGGIEGDEPPNLMVGLSGIGHTYLRLFRPESVPSILLIHSPSDQRSPDNWADTQSELSRG